MKDSEAGECRSLREIELEVEVEMREWGRKRLQEKLQEEADRHGRVFPPQRPPSAPGAPDCSAAAHRRRRD
jgi:hypothetical protein